jgi:hypothetical protein
MLALIHKHPQVEPPQVVALGDAHTLAGAFATDALRGDPYGAGPRLARNGGE